MYKSRNGVFHFFCVLLILISSLYQGISKAQVPVSPTPANAQPGPDLTNLFENMPQSEEELAKWQREVDAEINKYVSSLPKEQQEQFYKDVEELTNVMNNMSDEELTNFVNTLATQEQPPSPQPAPQPYQPVQPVRPTPPQPMPMPAPVQLEPKYPSGPTKFTVDHLHTSMLAAADDIDSFMLKVNIMATEIRRLLENWQALNLLRDWKPAISWDILRADIQLLSKRLRTVAQERVPGTNKYRYLPILVEKENLCNTIERLHSVLRTYEPKFEVPAFGLGELSKQSEKALLEIARVVTESAYTLDLLGALDNVIKGFEPEAKKISAAEEELRKKAKKDYEELKRREKKTPIVVTEGTPYSLPPAPTRTLTPPPAPTPFAAPKEEKKPTEEKKKEEPKKEAGKEKEKEKDKEKAGKIDDLLDALEGHLEDFVDVLNEFPNLKSIQSHARAAGPVDATLSQAISDATEHLSGARSTLRDLKRKMNTLKKEQSIAKELGRLNKIKNKYIDMLSGLNAQIESLIKDPSISTEKQQVYLGIKKQAEEIEGSLKAQADAPEAEVEAAEEATEEAEPAAEEAPEATPGLAGLPPYPGAPGYPQPAGGQQVRRGEGSAAREVTTPKAAVPAKKAAPQAPAKKLTSKDVAAAHGPLQGLQSILKSLISEFNKQVETSEGSKTGTRSR